MRDSAPEPKSELRIVLIGLLLAMTLAALDQNIVATALPRIVGDLGGLELLSWVVTSFMVASTTSAPIYGKLSDMYGRRPAFFGSIGLFLLGSVLCGLSHHIGQLIFFRAIQGLGAGGLMTLSQTTIGDLVSPRERGRYQGMFAGVFAVCSVAGPLLGGFITEALSWRWIFYVNLPVGAAALFFITVGLKAKPRGAKHRIDYLGAGLLVSATCLLLLVLSCGGVVYPWASAPILLAAAAAVALFTLLVVVERRAAEPILPPVLFRSRVFVLSVVIIGLTMMAMFGAATFLPLFFQLELDAGPQKAGLMMTPLMAGVIIASITGGRLVTRTGRYKPFPIIGLTIATTGFVAMAVAARRPDAPLVAIELVLAAIGMGLGFVMPNLTTAIQNAVARENMGVATSGTSFFRSLGGAVGVAIAGTVLNAHIAHQVGAAGGGGHAGYHSIEQIRQLPQDVQLVVTQAYRTGVSGIFLAGGAIAGLALLLALFVPEIPLRARDALRPAEAAH